VTAGIGTRNALWFQEYSTPITGAIETSSTFYFKRTHFRFWHHIFRMMRRENVNILVGNMILHYIVLIKCMDNVYSTVLVYVNHYKMLHLSS
jgi:hypothetical protein